MHSLIKTKRRIAIIGAGQAGLQLAIHLLLKDNYQVSLYTEKNALEILNGRIFSSQGMFSDALQIEKKLGLNNWDDVCPRNHLISFSLATKNNPVPTLAWKGKTKKYFQSIDQRLKFSTWMKTFEMLGGDIVYQRVIHEDLLAITNEHELTIVATGKGELSKLFSINTECTRHTQPQRILSCLYLKNSIPNNLGLHVNMLPQVGEFFSIAGHSHTGACEMLLFEGIPGREFDCWQNANSIEEQFTQAKYIMENYFPWEFARFAKSEIVDSNAGLIGQYTPKICHPIAKLSNNKIVLGLGDAINLNDPIAGQGANLACKSAFHYANAIFRHGINQFDEQWMLKTSESNWKKHSQHATNLSNFFLDPPMYLMNILETAGRHPVLANQLANGFNEPKKIKWLYNEELSKKHLNKKV